MAKAKYAEWLEEDGLTKLEAWARNGLTDEQIAHNMGISVRTLSGYKENHLPILQALKRGKEVVDIEVENALYKRAMGYKFKEVTRERVKGEDGEYELVVTKEVVKEVAPDTTAQIFWLKNRKPKDWRDKQDIEHSGDVNIKVVIEE
jgi:transcriptional regulator with XRE-family HTH domain